MFSSICIQKRIFYTHRFVNNSYLYESSLFILQNALFRSGYRRLSSDCLNNFSTGASPETVVKDKSEKIEKVKALFRNYGFNDTHISSIAKMLPTVFLCDPQKILSPKLDFLHSIGVLKTDIPKTIVSNPSFLGRSLEKQIIPCYNFLKSVPLSDKELLMMINRNARILGANVEMVASNVEVLRQYGVPPSSISFLISRHPSAVQRDNEKFKKCLDEVTRMGFNPLNTVFVLAVDVLCTTSKLTWDLKFDVFRRFGLSDDEILLAFRLHPSCMHLSEKKIARGMNFFVNEMKREPASVIRTPAVLFYSMEKRIIPRCRVIVHLVQKGFLKHNYQLMSFLKYTEEDFLSKFVDMYKDDLPELMDIYNQGMVCGDSICLDPTVMG